MTGRLIHGDCLRVMRRLANDGKSFDSAVTDPPYELGFMSKSWDRSGISFCPETWSLVLALLKPGGHLLAFGGSRTYHRMACAIEDAGFEIRDQIMWIYGSGFPKSYNIGNGWGTALKPAHEPLVLARKPLAERTVADNVVRYGTGGMNVDRCRVEAGSRPKIVSDRRLENNTYSPGLGGSRSAGETSLGRWPANVIHDGSDEVEAAFAVFGDKRPATSRTRRIDRSPFTSGEGEYETNPVYTDTGTASRFFYCAKASKSERAGSKHPTVKPLALMQYLVRLVTPPGGTVLDPFAGSGSTGIACKKEGFEFVGIEKDTDVFQDACSRIRTVIGASA